MTDAERKQTERIVRLLEVASWEYEIGKKECRARISRKEFNRLLEESHCEEWFLEYVIKGYVRYDSNREDGKVRIVFTRKKRSK